jgi:two-component system, NtrC family, sensor kinase
MSNRTTTLRLSLSLVAIILVANVVLALFSINYLNQVLHDEVQETVRLDLNSARAVYQHQMDSMRRFLDGAVLQTQLISVVDGSEAPCPPASMRSLQRAGGLDMLALVDLDGRSSCQREDASGHPLDLGENPIVMMSLGEGQPAEGTIIVPARDLAAFDPALAERASFSLVPTPAAVPTDDRVRSEGMVVAVAVPVRDADGEVVGALYGGSLLNRHFDTVDTIREQVYQNRVYEGRDIGTATIFQWDLRISTNVQNRDGERALGTRLSQEVYERVLEDGDIWADRAFVVNDWYITAYEPIHDPNGEVIGSLYVGLLEAPFERRRTLVVVVFLGILGFTTIASLLLLVSAIRLVLRPIGSIVRMTRQVSGGDLSARIDETPPGELGAICSSVNEMAAAVEEREKRLEAFAQRQIGQSEKLAAIGRLAAGVAHEINNPLTGVLTFAHLLKEKPHMTEEDHGDLDLLVKETTRVRDIVRSLLEFSRESATERRDLDLNQLVRSTIRLLESQKLYRRIQFEVRLEPAPVLLTGDADQLKQVLLNLLLNACEAMPDGGLLSVTTAAEDHSVRLEVEDTGCGISADNLDAIFDPFFTTKPVGSGTGLGLSVSYGIIQQHGGSIQANSEPGVGTRFVVRMPVTPLGPEESPRSRSTV